MLPLLLMALASASDARVTLTVDVRFEVPLEGKGFGLRAGAAAPIIPAFACCGPRQIIFPTVTPRAGVGFTRADGAFIDASVGAGVGTAEIAGFGFLPLWTREVRAVGVLGVDKAAFDVELDIGRSLSVQYAGGSRSVGFTPLSALFGVRLRATATEGMDPRPSFHLGPSLATIAATEY